MRRQDQDWLLEAVRRWRSLTFLLGLSAVALSWACAPALAAGEGKGITVEGNRLVKDGQPWIPKGFSLVSFVAPEAVLSAVNKEARSSYGPQLLDRARSLGADLLRFQVSQAGLDPQTSIYDPNYLAQVTAAVKQARDKGFTVIVSMQWEPPSGLNGQPNMPSDITRRAWSVLARPFADDKYVMLELFNEPAMKPSNPEAWPTWKSDMQSVVDLVRRNGAQNTLLLDGLRSARYLKDAPQVNDPLHKLAYAVHPYIDNVIHGPADWTRDFGNFAAHHPVLVTEWNATAKLEECSADMPQVSRELIAYLKERQIGLVLWAFDLRKTLFDDSGKPLEFKDFQCGKWGAGAAHVALEYFRSN